MRKLLLVFALLLLPSLALAQGCGPRNPNCIVPTAPTGTSDNRAASTAFVQTTASAPIPPLVLNPTANSVIKGITITQSSPITAGAIGNTNYNTITVNSAANYGTGGQVGSGFKVSGFVGGPNANGNWWNIWSEVDVINTTVASLVASDTIAAVQRCVFNNSTNTTGGVCAGWNGQGILINNSALNVTNGEVLGGECDARIDSGSSAAWRFGCAAVSTGAVKGTLLDAAYEVGAVTSDPWGSAIVLNDGHGSQPLDGTTGALVSASSNTAYNIHDLIALPHYTVVTGNIFSLVNLTWTAANVVTTNAALTLNPTTSLQFQSNTTPTGDFGSTLATGWTFGSTLTPGTTTAIGDFTAANAAAGNTLRVTNTSTVASSIASIVARIGTGSIATGDAITIQASNTSGTLQGFLTTGSGLTSGLQIQTSAGAITIVPGATNVSLSFATSGVITLFNQSVVGGAVAYNVCAATNANNSTGGALSLDGAASCLVSTMLYKRDIAAFNSSKMTRLAFLNPITTLENMSPTPANVSPLVEIMKLAPAQYRGDGENIVDASPQFGIMAQDACDVDERLCVRFADGSPRAPRSAGLMALAIGAIQQLKADNDNLRHEVEGLKRRVR
jgi:hypothetical protein